MLNYRQVTREDGFLHIPTAVIPEGSLNEELRGEIHTLLENCLNDITKVCVKGGYTGYKLNFNSKDGFVIKPHKYD